MKWYWYVIGVLIAGVAAWWLWNDKKKVHASAAKARAAKEEKRLINLNTTDDVTIRKFPEEVQSESGKQPSESAVA